MAQKKFTASKAQMAPDPKYGSLLITKFVNVLMLDGKKSTARRVFYDAMDRIAEKISDASPDEVFQQALENVKPHIEVRSKRVGGATYQVPIQISSRRRQSLAIRWILQAVRAKSGQPISKSLAEELMAAYRKEGAAINTREQIHRMAEANKAFAHFAW